MATEVGAIPMQLHQPLRIVSSTVDGDVLVVLAGADGAFTGRGLHRAIGRHSPEGVRLALERLTEQGIVTVEAAGPSKLYRLNREHLAAPHIVGLSHLSRELFQRLRERFDEWVIPAVYASVFGSAVRGEMRPDSDIDLFVVRPETTEADDDGWAEQLDALVRDASKWTGNDVRPLEMSETEVAVGVEHGDEVLASIRDEGVHVAGPSGYLRRARGRPARGPAR